MAQAEVEKESMITPHESRIARAVIASERRSHPVEGWVEMEILGKKFKLGGSLSEDTRRQVAGVIERHLDAFAWSASDMPGIDPDFLCHRLAMDPQVRPVRRSVFVSHVLKLGTRGYSRRERCIRALSGRVSEKGEIMCFVVPCMRVA